MYTPSSYRQLKKYIGELTAVNAGVHAVLLDYVGTHDTDSPHRLSHTAQHHGIVLSGITVGEIINRQSQLSLVSILSGFDCFYSEIETECKALGMLWNKPEKTSPITVLLGNIPRAQSMSDKGKAALQVIEYYRAVRNWIAHPSDKNKAVAVSRYKQGLDDIEFIREEYGFKTAPNEIDDICFHDIKLVAKLLLDALKELSEKLRPTDEQLVSSVPKKFLHRDSDKNKRVKRAAKYLQSAYGLKWSDAVQIVENKYDVLA